MQFDTKPAKVGCNKTVHLLFFFRIAAEKKEENHTTRDVLKFWAEPTNA